ncbi:MAG: heavy metal translocating P-type ATPase, partial [Polyangiales bacterium]
SMPMPRSSCRHCGEDLPDGLEASGFCCSGCEYARALLESWGLDRYYALRTGDGAPIGELAPQLDSAQSPPWLEAIERARAACDGPSVVDVDVQGLHCSACVWLIEQLFRRHAGALAILVNPARGALHATITPAFSLSDFHNDLMRLGYRLGPHVDRARLSNGLLVRMGVCIALAMNSMLFAISLYAGAAEPTTVALFTKLNFAIGFASVAVGGPPFFVAALRSLRARVVSLDVPIALGMVLAFTSSTWSFLARSSKTAYFDTLSVFIALMLVGRWLNERTLERHRNRVLADDGVGAILTRRVDTNGAHLVPCSAVRAGDRLSIAVGDLVPVDAILSSAVEARVSLDWITGESAPKTIPSGALLQAGSFVVGTASVEVTAAQDFADSRVVSLLRSAAEGQDEGVRATAWWRAFSRAYVSIVLGLAACTLVGWLVWSGDLRRALDSVTALLIVTCPCALGIATPLAYDLTLTALRKRGLFVRAAGFLDRALAVRTVVFDKTGTLTTGALTLVDSSALATLTDDQRGLLYSMVARSSHPKSVAVARALASLSPTWLERLEVHERPGLGLESEWRGHQARVGSRAHAGLGTAEVVFTIDGLLVCELDTCEVLRRDAVKELDSLRAAGLDVHILSGDTQARVDALAARVGLSPSHAHGAHTPEQKAAWIEAHGPSSILMIGDGINDAVAFERARCSGTPVVDRPFMPSRADFYLVGAGLAPIGDALRASHALAKVVRRNLFVALAYNAVTIALAISGRMTPLLCAIAMPLSSLSVIGVTLAYVTRATRRESSKPEVGDGSPRSRSVRQPGAGDGLDRLVPVERGTG